MHISAHSGCCKFRGLVNVKPSAKMSTCHPKVNTVGDIVCGIETRDDLLKIRNLGKRSADEIMEAIMVYQYSLLSDERKVRYLKRVAELNRNSTAGQACG